MKNGPLIEAELREDLDRFAAWLANDEPGDRRRRRKPAREATVSHYRERVEKLLRRARRIVPDVPALREAFLAVAREPSRFNRPASDSTLRNNFYALKAWARWKGLDLGVDALEAFDVPKNPDNGRGPESVMAPEDVRLFFARLAEAGDRRNYAMVRLFLRAGPRRRVVALARVRDFNHAERSLQITTEAGKGGRSGILIMDAVTADAIQDYLDARADCGQELDAPLFASYYRGGHLTPDAVSGLVYRLTERFLGERWTAHELRHTFITFAANGVEGEPMPIAQLQRQVQHTRATTTLRYVHATGNPRAAYDRAMGGGPRQMNHGRELPKN